MNIEDLLDLCRNSMGKKIFIMLNGKKIPMSTQYYIADDIVFFEVNLENKNGLDDNGFIWEMENEVENDSCWSENIYKAPMERLGECELKFAKDFNEVIQDDIFDNCYEITNYKSLDNEIIIYLKNDIREIVDEIIEWCDNCGQETRISVNGGKCEHCGKFLLPCCLCDMDKVNCKKCKFKNGGVK